MSNTRAIGLSRKRISEITYIVRSAFGFENEEYFPIVACIEFLAAEDDDFNFEIVEPAELSDTYATTNTDQNVMYIRKDVYERAANGNPRDRFTLCHELGHYFLHQPGMISNARGKVPKYCDPEWQANTFAGELMAPKHLIKNMQPEEIAQKCGMSRVAAEIQYKMLLKCAC